MDMIVIENETIYQKEALEDTHYRNCEIRFEDTEHFIRNVVFERCTFIYGDKHKWDIRDCTFKNCDLSLGGFEDSYLMNVTFDYCKLMSFSLHQCYLHNLLISNSMGQYFGMSDSKIRSATFKSTPFHTASFMHLDHKNMTFHECRLDECNFEETRLKGIDLRSCEFSYILYSPHLVKGLKIRSDQAIIFAIQMGLEVDY